jgi:hypothetical protein
MPTRQSKQEKSAPVDPTITTANAVDGAAVEGVKAAPAAEVNAAAHVPESAARPASDERAQPRAIASPQPIPGASVMGRGIYIKPRQPYELKASLFDLGQQQDQLFTSWETGQSYLVPENCVVNNSPPAPADQSLGETVIEESWDRFGKELTLNVNAAVSSSLISIDPSAIRAASLRSEEDSYYALRSSFIAFWNISLIDVADVPALEKDVDDLPAEPLDPASRGAYARIFDKYGSHYVKSAWIGGKASLVFVVAKSSQLTKDEVRAGIQASLGGILKGGTSTEQKSVSDRFKSSSTCKVFGSGGDRVALAKLSSLDPKVYGDWIESVKHNPQVIQLGLAGIWTLIKNPAKAEALKIAYVQESSFKPISAIIPVTMSFGAGVESRLYFLKDEDVFEYRLRQKPGEAKTRRNPEFVVELRRRLEQSPVLSKFARPDAAMSMNGFTGAFDNGLYLFKHGQCLRLDVNTGSMTVSDGYPRDIAGVLPGVDFDRIDAALAVAPERIYFFRGPNYIRVDLSQGKPPVVRARDVIKRRWAGVTFDRLDTAVYWGNSKVYLFYGDQYIRYDMSVCRADPGYPRFIENNYVEDWELFE